MRFELQGTLEMDRLQFSRYVIQKELGFSPTQLDFIFAFPGKKTFEVIFTTNALFERCVSAFNQMKDSNPRLENISLTPLSEQEPKVVTVIMYSEKVTTEDIQTWLSFQCTVNRGMELRDEDGIRTGARRFYVRLRRDQQSGQLLHLPSTIQLGSIRGHVFYSGQPKTCRKCGSMAHLAANCDTTHCKNCKGSDHATKDCTQPMRCNLCGSSCHTFRTCPESYANRTRQFIPDFQEDPRDSLEGQPDTQNQTTQKDEGEVNDRQLALSEGGHQHMLGQVSGKNKEDHPGAISPVVKDTPMQEHKDHIGDALNQKDWTEEHTITPEFNTSHPHSQEDWTANMSMPTINSTHLPTKPNDKEQAGETATHRQLDQPTLEPQESQQSQEVLPPGYQEQPSIERPPVSSRDCRDLLDLMLGDLPSPGGAAGTSSLETNQVLSGGTEVLPSLTLLSDTPLACTSSRKRSQETSGDSSFTSPDPEVWPNPLSISSPFLDPKSLSAFSVTTQMNSGTEETEWNSRTQKKKKKKRQSPSMR